MATILRKEWFGGLIGNTEIYDVRVLNRFSYSMFSQALSRNGKLDSHHYELLDKVGFNISDQYVRLISQDCLEPTPILSAHLILWLELTSACPLKCKHCFIDCPQTERPTHLPFFYVNKVLEEAAELGVFRITLSGGEAFLYPHIQKTISKVNKLGMGLRIFTNGVLKKSVIEWLREYQIDTLFVSVDGPEEHHDYLRGKNTFAHVAQTLNWLSTIGSVKNTILSISLDRYNSSRFNELFSLGTKYGIKTLLVRPLMGYAWAKEVSDLVFSSKLELFDALKEIEEQAKKYSIECQINKIPHMPIDKTFFVEDHKKNASLWNIIGLNSSIDCVGGNLVCGIRYDGIVSPCGFIDFEHDSNPDNSIYNKSLLELWRNSSNLRMMRDIQTNGDCAECAAIDICNLWC